MEACSIFFFAPNTETGDLSIISVQKVRLQLDSTVVCCTSMHSWQIWNHASTAGFTSRSFSPVLPSHKSISIVLFLFFAIAINLCDFSPVCQRQVNKSKCQESQPNSANSPGHDKTCERASSCFILQTTKEVEANSRRSRLRDQEHIAGDESLWVGRSVSWFEDASTAEDKRLRRRLLAAHLTPVINLRVLDARRRTRQQRCSWCVLEWLRLPAFLLWISSPKHFNMTNPADHIVASNWCSYKEGFKNQPNSGAEIAASSEQLKSTQIQWGCSHYYYYYYKTDS